MAIGMVMFEEQINTADTVNTGRRRRKGYAEDAKKTKRQKDKRKAMEEGGEFDLKSTT